MSQHSPTGQHLLIDLWSHQPLNDIKQMECLIHTSLQACKATLLHLKLYHFNQNNGISGVAILAESHLSVHTWPEHQYAAFDLFMCGNAKPMNIIPILQKQLTPFKLTTQLIQRGQPASPYRFIKNDKSL